MPNLDQPIKSVTEPIVENLTTIKAEPEDLRGSEPLLLTSRL